MTPEERIAELETQLREARNEKNRYSNDIAEREDALKYVNKDLHEIHANIRQLKLTLFHTNSFSPYEHMKDSDAIKKAVNYRNHMYLFIIKCGLFKEFMEYHARVKMLEPGAHEQVVAFILNEMDQARLIDPSLN
jgi:hypothetical protein